MMMMMMMADEDYYEFLGEAHGGVSVDCGLLRLRRPWASATSMATYALAMNYVGVFVSVCEREKLAK